uniref:G_PROTEIN_RECEP_F1_2 domain-containing protein n=1 Tax=Caenorhabditis tropicalis TaxID=1561998 RepID=A0A1I7V0E7_9PELO
MMFFFKGIHIVMEGFSSNYSTTSSSIATDSSEDEDQQPHIDMSFAKGFMTVVYIVVCLVGTPGNLWIIYKLFRAKLWSGASVQLTVSQRSRIYIFALACSDMFLLLTLPATASYNYHGTWIFGSAACYIIRSIEIFAKLFSVILLTVMSLERYVIVCTRYRHVYRAWMSLVPLGVGTIFGVLVPTIFHFLYLQHFAVPFPDSDVTWVCLPIMANDIFNTFAQYTFVVGFIIPFAIMTACYILLVRHVKTKYKMRRAQQTTTLAKPGKEPRYMSEVKKSIWRIAVFHFVCWAPFWGFTMLPNYIYQIDQFLHGESEEEESGGESILYVFILFDSNHYIIYSLVYCRLVSNCLPYINAAGNWVLYALLNVDVRKHIYNQPKKKRKFTLKFNPVNTSSNC